MARIRNNNVIWSNLSIRSLAARTQNEVEQNKPVKSGQSSPDLGRAEQSGLDQSKVRQNSPEHLQGEREWLGPKQAGQTQLGSNGKDQQNLSGHLKFDHLQNKS